MLREFKEFALRGNVVDMAVGIIVGAASILARSRRQTAAGAVPGRSVLLKLIIV